MSIPEPPSDQGQSKPTGPEPAAAPPAASAAKISQRTEAAIALLRKAVAAGAPFVPAGAAGLTFLLGAGLLLTGSIPQTAWTGRAREMLGLATLEASHLLASLIGVWLLILARGLQHRLDGAWHIAIGALIAGGLFATGRDLNLLAAAPYVLAAGVLYASRRQFYRRASLLDEPFSVGWVLSIAIVVALSLGLGFFAFNTVEYSEHLWWSFAVNGDAPRFLRASIGVGATLLAFMAARLVRPVPQETRVASDAELDQIAPIVAQSPAIEANLAFLKDKQILVSEQGGAFLMFAISGSSWISMGDPVGRPEEFDDLVWSFHELADQHGGNAVFYQVSARHLPLYIDLGLAFFKLGEAARVPLTDFTMEGKAKGDFRQALRKVEKLGGSFEVVPVDGVAAILPELRAVSDEWLEAKNAREKRFSLGRFDEDYVRRFPVALLRIEGEIVAFANMWCAGGKEIMSPDLMRYSSKAPGAVMDALFTHMMLWGQSEGYAAFWLGMAPMSGMEARRLGPLWQRMGSMVQRYGGHFYNFRGLRGYKEKFQPEWEPRYLAAAPGLSLPGVVADVLSLVSGGD